MALENISPDFGHPALLKGIVFIAASISCYWLLPVIHGLLFAPTRKIPGPFWSIITRWAEFGAVLRGHSNLDYIRLHEKLGPVVRVAPNRYSFSDPADVKIIYELGGKFFKSAFYQPLLSPNIEEQNIFPIRDAKLHKERRRLVGSLYTMSTMKSYEGAVDRINKVCVRKFRQFADEERLIPLPKILQFYAFDVIGEITYDKSFGMLEGERDDSGIMTDIKFTNTYLGHVGLVPDLHPYIDRIQRARGKAGPVEVLVKYTEDQIAAHSAVGTKESRVSTTDSFLTKILRLKAEKGIGMGPVYDSVGSNIGAGSDTTAISLSAALWYLYKNPDKLAKLRHEIDTLAAEGQISDPVTFEEAQKMPYLQAVIKESLRMHPAVGTILPRNVPKGGMELAGTYFPEGTEVGANAWVLHYNKKIFGPDADIYRPERWLGPKGYDKDMDSMMFAFGAGSRTCIGKNISLLEMTKVIPLIVAKFDLEFENDRPMETRSAWFVYIKYNVRVKLRGTA